MNIETKKRATRPLIQWWGPVALSGGKTRFQLWAPAETSVGLRLGEADIPMQRSPDGWHVVETAAPFGARYQFVLSDGKVVGDPASRLQSDGLEGPSVIVDPDSYRWRHPEWSGRPWEETVVYEVHIGALTTEGTFRSAMAKLPLLADLGITAVEVMPLAHFPGTRGWGYDGVLQFAPHNSYGTPDDLKAFIDAAHGHGLMVFLDVVYNHFGPEGNYLGQYAPGFFRKGDPTPWGAAIAYERPEVRSYFLENVLYWLHEFRLDGLRFDAIDQIEDGSDVHILEQIAIEVREKISDRHVHLITENPANGTDLMQETPGGRYYKADWNDDFHHAVHVAVTGEATGYYEPFTDDIWGQIRRVMASGYLRPGRAIVSDDPPPSEALPPTAFIHFLQNHDQIGNRALGDRLHLGINRQVYRALTEILLLSPQIPMMFMGDEHLSLRPFHFFSDYHGQIAKAIRENRPKEAENFGGIPSGKSAADIADPNNMSTFVNSKVNWDEAASEGAIAWAEFIRKLLALRKESIVPLLESAKGYAGSIVEAPDQCLFIDWQFGHKKLHLRANLSDTEVALVTRLGDIIYSTEPVTDETLRTHVVQVFVS
ncbi:malto-oligosyltrehalose trehalohydrolase [Rhizobium sp. S152]|uniref:malto-oligosyltrehalose trehalohydrolase n=1 Tax=Rhizobium sp. S152 TaxID=3055038 RepID=UPI0025A957E9|nr:malto-oligosyltrehalose trehalohydrolase [Rhizobium sp. S152]MDM9627655.1 malto-oligosyltrehalose trehalohydrolase [Rhizobium sp. S152]